MSESLRQTLKSEWLRLSTDHVEGDAMGGLQSGGWVTRMFPRLYNCLSFRRPLPPRSSAAAAFLWSFSRSQSTLIMSVKQFVDVGPFLFLFTLCGNRIDSMTLSQAAISDNKVAIFSKSYCPYCRKAKALFKDEFPDLETTVYEYAITFVFFPCQFTIKLFVL